MKKLSSFIFFLIILCGLIYLLTSHLESDIDPVSLLPTDTIALLDLHDPGKSYKRFRKSKLGSKIDSIPWKEILMDSGLTDEQATRIVRRYHEGQAIMNSSVFRELFGRRALFALLPTPSGSMSQKGHTNIKNHVLLVCRPQHSASLLQLFSYFFTGSYEFTSYSYLGKQIRKYSFDNGLVVFSTVTDGLVLIALSEQPLKDSLVRSLNYMTGERTGLDTERKYRNIKQRTKGSDDQFFYVDLKRLSAVLDKGTKSLEQLVTHSAQSNFFPIELPYSRFAFYRQPGKSKYRYTAVLQYNQENQGAQSVLLFPPPTENKYLQELPADLVFYFWTNAFDINTLWNTIILTAESQWREILIYLEQWIFANTGLSKDQFFDQFGHQFSLNFAEIRASGFIPLPRVCMRLELVDPEKTKAIVEKLVDALPLDHKMVGQHKMHSLMLADGLMRPSYAYVDNFLVIADSQEQLVQVLEKDKKLLVRDSSFKKIDIGLNKPNNVVLYYKLDHLVDAIKKLLILVGTLNSTTTPKRGIVSKAVVDTVLLPVLDDLKMYKAKSVRVFQNETEVIMESALLLKKM